MNKLDGGQYDKVRICSRRFYTKIISANPKLLINVKRKRNKKAVINFSFKAHLTAVTRTCRVLTSNDGNKLNRSRYFKFEVNCTQHEFFNVIEHEPSGLFVYSVALKRINVPLVYAVGVAPLVVALSVEFHLEHNYYKRENGLTLISVILSVFYNWSNQHVTASMGCCKYYVKIFFLSQSSL